MRVVVLMSSRLIFLCLGYGPKSLAYGSDMESLADATRPQRILQRFPLQAKPDKDLAMLLAALDTHARPGLADSAGRHIVNAGIGRTHGNERGTNDISNFAGDVLRLRGGIRALDTDIDPQRCMGTWYVQRAIPAVKFLEKDARNGKEEYSWDKQKNRIDVKYTFNAGSLNGPLRTVRQVGWVTNKKGTKWAVSPRIGGIRFPFKLPYLIIDIDTKNYTYLTATGGLNSWMYTMTREKKPSAKLLQELEARVADYGFDMTRVLPMEHND